MSMRLSKQEKFAETKGFIGGKKCAVKGCTNRYNEGKFIGMVCSPCYEKMIDKIKRGKSNKS